jgi:hypothetical protein
VRNNLRTFFKIACSPEYMSDRLAEHARPDQLDVKRVLVKYGRFENAFEHTALSGPGHADRTDALNTFLKLRLAMNDRS